MGKKLRKTINFMFVQQNKKHLFLHCMFFRALSFQSCEINFCTEDKVNDIFPSIDGPIVLNGNIFTKNNVVTYYFSCLSKS